MGDSTTEKDIKPEPVKEETPISNSVQAHETEVVPPTVVEKKTTAKVITPTTRTTASRSSVGARAPRKSAKPGKLGIKKTPVNFNFEAAEAQAKDEMERKAKYDNDDDEEEGILTETPSSPTATTKSSFSTRLAYIDSNNDKKEESDYEKLGFGMNRLNMKENIRLPPQQEDDNTRTARDKFGSAKAISSDQYFGRNEYDPAISAAESSRLSQFSNAKSISSDQYFGRDSEVDNTFNRNRSYSNSAVDWDNVQDQAVAMARKFVDQASLDLDAVKDLAENATNKVRNYFGA